MEEKKIDMSSQGEQLKMQRMFDNRTLIGKPAKLNPVELKNMVVKLTDDIGKLRVENDELKAQIKKLTAKPTPKKTGKKPEEVENG